MKTHINPEFELVDAPSSTRKGLYPLLALALTLTLLVGLALGMAGMNAYLQNNACASAQPIALATPTASPPSPAVIETASAGETTPPAVSTGPSVVLATTPAAPGPGASVTPDTTPAPVTPKPVVPVAVVTPPVTPAATQEPAPGESVAPTAPAVTATTPVAAKPTTEELAERFKGVTRPERIWPEYERFSKVPTSMLKQFGGMTTEEFYAWRREHTKEALRVPRVVDEAFMEGDRARRPDMQCQLCSSSEPKDWCEQWFDAKDLQGTCNRGARFLGDEEKPLRKVLEQRLEEKAAKAKASQ